MIPFLIVISITALVKNKAALVVVPTYTEKTKRSERDDTILDVSAKSTISPSLHFFFNKINILFHGGSKPLESSAYFLYKCGLPCRARCGD